MRWSLSKAKASLISLYFNSYSLPFGLVLHSLTLSAEPRRSGFSYPLLLLLEQKSQKDFSFCTNPQDMVVLNHSLNPTEG